MNLAFNPLIALGVMASTAATDAAYVFFNAAVSSRRRYWAAHWSSIWYMLSAFAVISYTENPLYVVFAAIGAWLGPVGAFWVAMYAGVAGGVMAVGVALATGYLRQAVSNVSLLLMHWRVCGLRSLSEVSLEGSEGPRLAYALPIFAGLVTTLWLR